MNIEKMLKEYREKCARIDILELEIEGLIEAIPHAEGIMETDEETIEGMALGRSMEGPGQSGNTSSKTERVALNYKEQQGKLKTPTAISELYEEIRKREAEKKRLLREVEPIKIALNGLSDKERLIIEEFYIKNNSWYVVTVRYQQRYGYPVIKDTCRKIRAAAINKIKRIMFPA